MFSLRCTFTFTYISFHSCALQYICVLYSTFVQFHSKISFHVSAPCFLWLKILTILDSTWKFMALTPKINQIYIYHLQNWQFTRGDPITLELRPSISCPPMWRIFSRLGKNSNEPWKNFYNFIHFIA